jgi:hypothetical protein
MTASFPFLRNACLNGGKAFQAHDKLGFLRNRAGVFIGPLLALSNEVESSRELGAGKATAALGCRR